eukprot:756659-Hanusia_phi.AAC.2
MVIMMMETKIAMMLRQESLARSQTTSAPMWSSRNSSRRCAPHGRQEGPNSTSSPVAAGAGAGVRWGQEQERGRTLQAAAD